MQSPMDHLGNPHSSKVRCKRGANLLSLAMCLAVGRSAAGFMPRCATMISTGAWSEMPSPWSAIGSANTAMRKINP